MIVIKNPRTRRPKQPQPTGPVGGLCDSRFQYRPSFDTNIRATFRRIANEKQRGARL